MTRSARRGGVAMDVAARIDADAAQIFALLLGARAVSFGRERVAVVLVQPVVRSVRASAPPAQAVSSGLERTSIRCAELV